MAPRVTLLAALILTTLAPRGVWGLQGRVPANSQPPTFGGTYLALSADVGTNLIFPPYPTDWLSLIRGVTLASPSFQDMKEKQRDKAIKDFITDLQRNFSAWGPLFSLEFTSDLVVVNNHGSPIAGNPRIIQLVRSKELTSNDGNTWTLLNDWNGAVAKKGSEDAWIDHGGQRGPGETGWFTDAFPKLSSLGDPYYMDEHGVVQAFTDRWCKMWDHPGYHFASPKKEFLGVHRRLILEFQTHVVAQERSVAGEGFAGPFVPLGFVRWGFTLEYTLQAMPGDVHPSISGVSYTWVDTYPRSNPPPSPDPLAQYLWQMQNNYPKWFTGQ